MLTIQRFAHLIGGARIADGSVCPTQGAANPASTIMALASRLAQRMAGGQAINDDPAERAGRRHPAGHRP